MSGMHTACLHCGTEVADEHSDGVGRLCHTCPGVVCESCAEFGHQCPECGSRLRDAPGP